MNTLASIIDDDQKSPFEEIEEQMISSAQDAFFDAPVRVTSYFDDLGFEQLEELCSRALREPQILFDFFAETPITDEDRKSTTQRIQKDSIQFGFFVAYAAVRNDEGYYVRKIAWRSIFRLRRIFYRRRLALTVRKGVMSDIPLNLVSIVQEDDIPGLVVYKMTFSVELPLQFN